jgi:hypothetical protein
MKTKGRRKSTNMVDLTWTTDSKGARLKPTPKRGFPVELKGTDEMNRKLSIESYKLKRRREKELDKVTILKGKPRKPLR